MSAVSDLTRLLMAIATPIGGVAVDLLDATPSLVTASVARRDEFFLAERRAQVYEGDTALHAAAFSSDADMARDLRGTRRAMCGQGTRRGAEPLHAAVIGAPGSAPWDPARQQAVILALIEAAADPNATAAGGVTPLHRAVRNRARLPSRCCCGSGPILASRTTAVRRRARTSQRWTTGRGGTGFGRGQAEQRLIIELFDQATVREASACSLIAWPAHVATAPA